MTFFADGILKQTNSQINANGCLDLQIKQMIEKSDSMWNCKVCGKKSPKNGDIRKHAERHIEGMSYACHICSKSYPNRPDLRVHMTNIHTKQGRL